jgi:glycosyltransferase involved in cell wall biosynthesis
MPVLVERVMERPRIGFVLEHSLGHVTHADNLRRVVSCDASIDARFFDVPFEVHGWPASLPGFNSNWTVRAGLRARRGIRRMHRGGGLDVLFVHTQVAAVLGLDWLARIPTVVSLDATPLQYDQLGEQYGHQVGGGRIERLKWRANQACLRRSAHIVTWSAWARESVVNDYGIDPAKTSVVPPGVVPAAWHRRASRVSDGVVRFLFVGGDLSRKGGDLLIEAFHDVQGRLAPGAVELHLVTKSDVAPAPGVHVHRDMRPNSAELIALYHSADVFCLPTRGDCLPMVLSEAGAAELPLVSTDVAAIPEIVRDGETGIVVPVGERAALARALHTLAVQPELRLRLGAAARHLVDQDFDAVKNAHALVELLRDVSSKRR